MSVEHLFIENPPNCHARVSHEKRGVIAHQSHPPDGRTMSKKYIARSAMALSDTPHGVVINPITTCKIDAPRLQIVRSNERATDLDEFVRERPLFAMISVFNQQKTGSL